VNARYFIDDGAIWVDLGGDRPLIMVNSMKCIRGYRWYSSVSGRHGYRVTFKDSTAALRAAAKTLGITISEVVA
jgi:hypothetical protein